MNKRAIVSLHPGYWFIVGLIVGIVVLLLGATGTIPALGFICNMCPAG